jgi:hypothetical protein
MFSSGGNLLEMKAVHLALSHFRATLHLKSLVLATDNTTVVAYLKNQGGTHCFNLYSLCREILLLCNKNDLARFPSHLLKDLGKKPEGRECVSEHSFPRD